MTPLLGKLTHQIKLLIPVFRRLTQKLNVKRSKPSSPNCVVTALPQFTLAQ